MSGTASLTAEESRAVEEFRKRHRTGVLALVFTDVVGSADLKRRLGDAAGTELIKRLHSLVRQELSSFSEADEISTAGDSFFLVFVKPSDAVRFSLRLQNALRNQDDQAGEPVQVRIGIHMGEVFIEEAGTGVLKRDILGAQVDISARVMSLARGGQILLTRSVFDNARTILTGEALPGIESLSWVNHGPYLLKGLDDALDLCEVGEREASPLRPPTDSKSGKRATLAGAEPVLGWRPAIEQTVPGTQWELERQLGEGGFGEVWLACHRQTKEHRVFKFCFRADQLRNLKREMTLFRLLKEVLGERPDIARLYEVQFEDAPYYLELEYTPGGDLTAWIESRGGFDGVPMDLRIEIVAQIAGALAAAHSVGVLHKDIKPSNILIEEKKDSSVQVRLTDFGIGEVTDRSVIERAGLTATGLTEMVSPSAELSTRSGTRLYMAPELTAGHAPSVRSDIFSLGVLFYQLIIGDLAKPVATDWDRHIDDPIVHHDLHHCLAGDPNDRFASADELAEGLRSLPERRAEFVSREAADRALARRRKIAVALSAVAALFLLLAGVLGYGLRREKIAHAETEKQLYFATVGMADKMIDEMDFDRARGFLDDCPEHLRGWEWGRLLYLCNLDRMSIQRDGAVISSQAFTPDGKRLVAGAVDGTVEIRDMEKGGRLLRSFKANKGQIRRTRISPDGKRLATCGSKGVARIWDMETSEPLFTLRGGDNLLMGLAFSPDGSQLATGGTSKTIRIWDTQTGRESQAIPGFSGGVHWVEFCPDGRHVAVADSSLNAFLVDLETGEKTRTYGGHTRAVICLDVSPDGKTLATASQDHTAKLWDLETGRELHTLEGHDFDVWHVKFNPSGNRVVTASQDKTARVWDVASGEELAVLKGHSQGVGCPVFNPAGRLATTAGDGTIKLWDLAGERRATRLYGHTRWIEGVAYSPGGRYLATGSLDQSIQIWDAWSGRRLRVFAGIGSAVHAVAYSPDGRHIAAGCDDNRIRIWDVETGRVVFELEGHTETVTSVAYSPDGRRLATGSAGAVKVWDLKTRQVFQSFEVPKDRVSSLVFRPDGKQLAGAVPGAIGIGDPDTGRMIRDLKGVTSPFGPLHVDLAYSPDGKILAGGCYQAIRLWDADTGEVLKTLEGHHGLVRAIAFSPDGRRLASGGEDSRLKIWDVASGREVLSLSGHDSYIPRLAFNPNGHQIATVSFDNTAILWSAFPWRENAWPQDESGDSPSPIEAYKRKYWERHEAGLAGLPGAGQPPFPVAGARRIFDADGYSSGVPVGVRLEILGEADATSLTVVENVPAGWAIEPGASGSGRHARVVENRIVWEISPWRAPGLTLEYTLTPPADSGFLPVSFSSAYVRAGSGGPTLIEDSTFHRAGTVAFRQGVYPNPDYAGCIDAHIFIFRPDHNTGASTHMEEGDWYGGVTDHKKMLVRFDLTSVPSTFPLRRAELMLFNIGERREDARNPHTLYAARLLKPWNEGEADHYDGRISNKGDVTFESARHGLMKWEIPGANGLSDVADAESSATAGAHWPEWVSLDVTESVRHFLANPEENFGWKVSQDPRRGVDDAATSYVLGAYMFVSREAITENYRPTLVLAPEDGELTVRSTQ